MNAAEMQGRLRAGGRSFLDRLRHFGGGAIRGTDAYWADGSDDVDAWLHYHVEQGNGVTTLFITGSCADFHWVELLDRIAGRIYIDTGESAGLMGGTRHVGTRHCRITPSLPRSFPRRGYRPI